MNIAFLDENGTVFAVAQNQKYKQNVYEELMYAEVTPFGNGFTVRWNDNFFSPEPFSSLEEAKQYIKDNHSHHEPESNGKTWL
jgi:hypothetical protein